MPKGAGAEGGETDQERYCRMAKEIYDRLPADKFDIEAVGRAFPPCYEDSTNVVLVQELLRFNKLYVKVKTTLGDLQKAVAGLVVMDDVLEEVATNILEGKVAPTWKKVSFPSLKPLGGYVEDLLNRLEMMQKWIDNGAPVCFWISGFFFTQAFLTGILQNMARIDKVAIDQCIWNFYVEKKKSLRDAMEDPYGFGGHITKPAKGCYIYGLFMEGARWDDENGVITESYPKVLFDLFPIIYMDPIERSADASPPNHYICPVYKTSERRGVLSTTGHSTNFVMPLILKLSDQHSAKFWTRRGVAMLTQLDQ